jgi:phage N-6-adenine-methyltransferase
VNLFGFINQQDNNMKHFVGKTDTPSESKDLWQTPEQLFDNLNSEFDFDIDVCADHTNALCESYFTEKTSALLNEWDSAYRHATCFMNPPYSLTQLFLERAAEQAKFHNLTVVALVNANTDTKWFADAVKSANEVRLISGRIGFIKPDGSKANGNTKGQCLIIWRGNCKTPCQITTVSRDELMKQSKNN